MRWITACLLCIMLPLVSTAQRHHANHAKKNTANTKPQWILAGTMADFQQAHLRYPDAEKEAGIQGRTLVAFTIAANGATTDIAIQRSSGSSGFDAEAVRYLKSMPSWKPATIHGKKVAYRLILPITFELE